MYNSILDKRLTLQSNQKNILLRRRRIYDQLILTFGILRNVNIMEKLGLPCFLKRL